MKYIKLFEYYNDIEVICNKYGIDNYTINKDGSIDVDGNVYLEVRYLTELPLKFNKVNGDFNCIYNQLTTLKGFPEVSGYIYIDENPLPKEILTNKKYLKDIIKNQYDYGIWNKNDTLNLARFEVMMEEIKNNQ